RYRALRLEFGRVSVVQFARQHFLLLRALHHPPPLRSCCSSPIPASSMGCSPRWLCGEYWCIVFATTNPRSMRLKDRVAIVTGGAHGMGEAEARCLRQRARKLLWPTSILEHEAETVAADIRAGGQRPWPRGLT